MDKTWLLAAPVVAVALAVVVILALDAATGGEATPGAYLGEEKAERFAYSSPTPAPTLPPGVTPTAAVSLPTAPAGRPGDPAVRDAQRRDDLFALVGAADDYKRDHGEYPTTGNNVQSLCAYVDLDQGCQLQEKLSPLPSDPLGEPLKNGYWYSSDGRTAKFYAVMEADIPAANECATNDAELVKRTNLVCIQAGP